MSKKKLWIILGSVGAVLLLGVILLIVFLPKGTGEEIVLSDEIDPAVRAKDYPDVTVDPDTGIIFVNRELVLMARLSASRSSVESLAESYEAVISDSTMEDLGFYVLRFNRAMTYAEITALMDQIRKSDIVENVFLNPVVESDEDDIISGLIPTAAAEADTEGTEPSVYYPTDNWGGASWDMDVPRGYNWGVEAIHAPAAWTHRNELGYVKVGLIDSVPSFQHEDLNNLITGYVVTRNPDNGRTTVREITNAGYTGEDHGTHVSSIMGARWESDSVGISGIMAGHAPVVYATCSDRSNTSGYHTAFTYVAAIRELLNQGVCAINISQNTSRLIGFAASRSNRNALNHLQTQADLASAMLSRIITDRQKKGEQDFVICVAAGNNNQITYYRDENATYGYSTTGKLFQAGDSGRALAKYNNFLNLIDEPAVMGRIIVVGSIGIDNRHSSRQKTKYAYSGFSNVGDRVDIVAPGEDIYACYATGYDTMSGTSMATPHVTAAAGMLFAAHSKLSGPQVKQILISTATEDFYYTAGHSSLLNLDAALKKVLGVKDRTPSKEKRQTSVALDLCFVIDTTGSMSDDIDDARKNMLAILDVLEDKTDNYRVALVDYRDFSERTGRSYDYPVKVQLDFTSERGAIVEAINDLNTGYGGDDPETVYSGLMKTLELGWRDNARRMIIIMGDAPPLDPEPYTDYTLDYVMAALYNASIDVDLEASDSRVLGESDRSAISIYSIGTGSDSITAFLKLSEATGGQYTDVANASEVSDAIIDSIDEMEMGVSVTADFGAEYADEKVEFYEGGEYLFSAPVSETGTIDLYSMIEGRYGWKIPSRGVSGSMTVSTGSAEAAVGGIWHRTTTIVLIVIGVLLLAGGAVLTLLLVKRSKAKRPKDPGPGSGKSGETEDLVPAPAPAPAAPDRYGIPAAAPAPVKPAPSPRPEKPTAAVPDRYGNPTAAPQPEQPAMVPDRYGNLVPAAPAPVKPAAAPQPEKPAALVPDRYGNLVPAAPQPEKPAAVPDRYSNPAAEQTPAAAPVQEVKPIDGPRFCPGCGNALRANSVFCSMCGRKVR